MIDRRRPLPLPKLMIGRRIGNRLCHSQVCIFFGLKYFSPRLINTCYLAFITNTVPQFVPLHCIKLLLSMWLQTTISLTTKTAGHVVRQSGSIAIVRKDSTIVFFVV